jgi:hypothetical protein
MDGSWISELPLSLLAAVAEHNGITESQLVAINSGITQALDGAYKLLKPVGFEFGYRVINEIVRYMAVQMELHRLRAGASGSLFNWIDALDVAIYMKVLPKLHGNRRQLGDSLKALGAFFNDNSGLAASYTLGSTSPIQIAEDEKLGFVLPHCRDKVNHLHNALQASGYATFIS